MGGMHTPEPWRGPLEVTYDPTNREIFAVPRSRLLRKEIAELESRAAAVEAELA
jgi:hypothetical protein